MRIIIMWFCCMAICGGIPIGAMPGPIPLRKHKQPSGSLAGRGTAEAPANTGHGKLTGTSSWRG